MATTKKSAGETAQKAAKTPANRAPAPQGAPAKSAAELKAASALEAAATRARAAQQLQMKQWEEAVQLFSKKQFGAAGTRFSEAAAGPAAHIADKARSYAQICARKTNGSKVALETADDHFNYGVERLNARDMDTARHHLDRALALEPQGEHILFTLALCCGLAGDGNGACENLRRAIAMEPRNRILARQDPEFSALAQQYPALRALLSPESVESF
jgi:hypothetical protein